MPRDSWCTPKWLAEALGRFSVDPCSNQYSHIIADWRVQQDLRPYEEGMIEDDGDGVFGPGCLACDDSNGTSYVLPNSRTFINPPYSRGQVARWVAHYKHTDFCFLLRWDPSTAWFKELMGVTNYVWFANRRINFEPPSGVADSSNPYPHALFFRSRPPTGLTGLGITLINDGISRYTASGHLYVGENP